MGVVELQRGELPQMPSFGESRASTWRPFRLLLGGLALTGGLLALVAVFGSARASAEEPPQDGHSPIASVTNAVSGVDSAVRSQAGSATGSASGTVLATTARVAVTVPAPVRSAVTHAAAVTDAAGSAVSSQVSSEPDATAPVARVVAPAAKAVDTELSSVPGATALLGDHPISTVTAPLTGTVVTVTGLVIGTVNDTITTVGTSGSGGATGSGSAPAGWTGDGSGSGDSTGTPAGAPGERLSLGADGAASRLDGADLRSGAAATCPESGSSAVRIGRAQLMSEPGGSPGGGAGAQPDLALPPGASSGSGSSGAAGPIVGADTTGDDIAAPVGARLSRLPQSDAVPSAPTADHDSSPD